MMEGWKTKTLGEITSFMAKGIPPKYVEHEGSGIIRVLNQKCNRDYKISYADSRLHNNSLKKAPKSKMLKPGDVLINSTGAGTAGRVAQIWNVPVPTTIDGHMILLRPTEEIDALYYGYALKSYQSLIESYAEGSTGQTEINKERLKNETVISFPADQNSQRAIARTLAAIDDKIDENERINKNLEAQAKTLFQKCCTQNPTAETWPLVTLDSLTSLICRGITPKYADDSYQLVLNQKCIRDHCIDTSLARTHNPKAINEKWLQYGDLLINSTGQGTLGRAAQVWFVPQNMTVDSHITIVRPKSQQLIFYIGFWGILHEREIESLHTGSTGQTELPRELVKAIKIRMPDKETLANLNYMIEPLTSMIIAKQRENEYLASLRDTLLPSLMSGKIDVSNIDL